MVLIAVCLFFWLPATTVECLLIVLHWFWLRSWLSLIFLDCLYVIAPLLFACLLDCSCLSRLCLMLLITLTLHECCFGPAFRHRLGRTGIKRYINAFESARSATSIISCTPSRCAKQRWPTIVHGTEHHGVAYPHKQASQRSIRNTITNSWKAYQNSWKPKHKQLKS